MPDRPRLLEPSRLAPVEVDLARVALAGTGLWLVAAVVALVLVVAGPATWTAVHVCVTGVVLGLLAVLWARRRARRTSTGADPGTDVGTDALRG